MFSCNINARRGRSKFNILSETAVIFSGPDLSDDVQKARIAVVILNNFIYLTAVLLACPRDFAVVWAGPREISTTPAGRCMTAVDLLQSQFTQPKEAVMSDRATRYEPNTGQTPEVEQRPQVIVPPRMDSLADVRFHNEIADMHRVCAQNEQYFGWKAIKLRTLNRRCEIAIEILSVLTAVLLLLAAHAFGSHENGAHVCHYFAKLFSMTALVLIIIKVSMRWAAKEDRMAKQRDEYLRLVVALDEIVRDIKLGEHETAEAGGHSLREAHRPSWHHVKSEYSTVKNRDPIDAITSKSEQDHFDALQAAIVSKYPNSYYMGVS